MKIFLCFIFLINYNVYCSDDNDGRNAEHYWLGHTVSGASDRETQDHAPDYIEKPCSVRDLDCIRQFFAHNLMCSPVHGPAPDPYIIQNLQIPLPHCNITLTLIDPHIKGLNSGKIQKFYVNKKTDTLVLEVEFGGIVVDTPVTVVTYHRRGKEPIDLHDDSMIEFRHLSLTLTIRNFSDQQHARHHVYAYFTDAKPPLRIGTAITSTKDPMLIRMNKEWMDKIVLSAREGFQVQGPIYMSAFLNSIICDFRH